MPNLNPLHYLYNALVGPLAQTLTDTVNRWRRSLRSNPEIVRDWLLTDPDRDITVAEMIDLLETSSVDPQEEPVPEPAASRRRGQKK